MVLFECMKEKDVIDLKENILKAMQEDNEATNRKYNLSISIGYSEFNEDMVSARQLIAQADKELYLIKQQRKIEDINK